MVRVYAGDDLKNENLSRTKIIIKAGKNKSKLNNRYGSSESSTGKRHQNYYLNPNILFSFRSLFINAFQ